MSLVAVERAVTTFSAQVVEVEGLLARVAVLLNPYDVRELALSLPQAEILIGPCEHNLDLPNRRMENLSLLQVAEELRRCRLFIGNDSGITHIAAYWGTPTVALFGATDPKVWGPVGRRVRILHRPSLQDISIDDVRKLL